MKAVQLSFDRAQGALQHLAVSGVGGAFELFEGAGAGKAQGLAAFASGARFRRVVGWRLRLQARAFLGLLNLIFDRFAFPPACHVVGPLV